MEGTVAGPATGDQMNERGEADTRVPRDREDGLARVDRRARRLLGAVLRADPDLDGFYASEAVVGLIAQEYEGRAVAELIQNAHDQLVGHGRIHILFVEEEGGAPVLYVANDGLPFADENLEAIVRIASSSKTPGTSIGYKGVGFKAVLQLAESPEIYSASTIGGPTFDGYRFRFGRYDDVVALADDEGAKTFVARLPPAALAIPLPFDASPTVAEFSAAGFSTLVRLVLDQPGAAKVIRELNELARASVPPQLFLEKVSKLIVERRGESPHRVELTRTVLPLPDVEDGLAGQLIDLGTVGSYFVASREVNSASFALAVRESIDQRQIDPRWAQAVGPTIVAVAVRVDAEPSDGRLYAFLPMSAEEAAPFAGHINAPFATRLARDRVRFDVPLNNLLIREAAAAAVEAATWLRAPARAVWRPVVADLISWHGSLAPVMKAAIQDIFPSADLVPAIDRAGSSWARFDEIALWRDDDMLFLRAAEVAKSSGARLADPVLGPRRLESLLVAAKDVFGCDASPTYALIAEWAEEVAAGLRSRRGTKPGAWLDLYDDLASIFSSNPSALEGRRILLTEHGELAACGSRGRVLASKSGPVVFFPPSIAPESEERDEEEATVRGRVPASLARRIAFMHPDLVWSFPSAAKRQREMRPSREFFAVKQLVRAYEAQDVLLLVRDVIASSNDRRLHADSLRFTFAQTRGRSVPAEPRLDSLGLRVPVKGNRWVVAADASFGAEWHSTNGPLLERVLTAWSASETMARVGQSLLAAPEDWPRYRLPKPDQAWLEFLRQLGVRDGLWPFDAKRRDVSGAGWEFSNRAEIVRRTGVGGVVADDWVATANRIGRNPYYTTVAYTIEGAVPVLPGHAEYESQDVAVRLLYGRLLTASLGRWPKQALEVEIRRPRGAPTYDSIQWPSPVRGFLEQRAWMPITVPRTVGGGDGRSDELAKPDSAWLFEEDSREQPPSFVPLISTDVRRQIISDQRLRTRLDGLGLRVWNAGGDSPARLALMADSFARFGVLDGLQLGFRKAYERSWAALLKTTDTSQPSQLPARVLVSVGNRLEVLEVEASDLWILATEERLTETLLRTVERPVLVADPADGPALYDLLTRRWGERVSAVAQGDTHVLVGGSVIQPNGDRERLLDRVGHWVAEVVALTLELKATQFNRQSTQTVRLAIERLRRIRILEASGIELRVRGVAVSPPPSFRAAVPADDDLSPTLVLGPETLATWDGLRSVIPALAELIRQPLSAPALRDAITDLSRVVGTDELSPPNLEEYASAFGESVDRVRVILGDHRGSLDELLFLLRPLIAVLAGVGLAVSFEPAGTDRESVESALAGIEAIGQRAHDLVEAASSTVDLAELRDRLGISVPTFNAALRELGDPYRPLRYEAEAWRALEGWLRERRTDVFDALRSTFEPEFGRLGALDHYARAAAAVDSVSTPGRRNPSAIEGLGPDTAWAEAYVSPPPDVVATKVTEWLALSGAALGQTHPSPSRDNAREMNARRVRELLPTLALTLAAWAAKHGRVEAPEWVRPDPASVVGRRLESEGWLDFLAIDDGWLIAWLVSRSMWPDGMPQTASLEELDLEPSDLDPQRSEVERQRVEEVRRRRSVLLDDRGISLDEGIDVLVGRVLEGIDANPGPMDAKLKLAKLKPAMPLGRRSGGGRGGGGGKGWDRLLSDDQKSLIGLIGEISAYEWLDRQIGLNPQCWRSTNRASRYHDDPGDDSLGFDIAVSDGSHTRYFEVKATTGDGSNATIEISPGEARLARSQVRGRYNVLLVTNVLDSSRRRFYLLPNPFGPESADLYRTMNRGFRFSFRL